MSREQIVLAGAATLVALILADENDPAGAAPAEDQPTALVEAARSRTRRAEAYDGSYRVLHYPMGDVPDDRGVCTDLVIRAYRALGIDLQLLVHEDMQARFADYPGSWGAQAPDRNVDHRRVPNLRRFFERAGAEKPVTHRAEDYRAGDLVTWALPDRRTHIGIVSDRDVPGARRPRILHNIGQGPVEDDILFRFPITGHYRFFPAGARK